MVAADMVADAVAVLEVTKTDFIKKKIKHIQLSLTAAVVFLKLIKLLLLQ